MMMSKVSKCEVVDCAFNRQMKCHALAINVGQRKPRCDTYVASEQKAGDARTVAGVGACKVSQCAFNRGMACAAGKIVVGYGSKDADCLTYQPTGKGEGRRQQPAARGEPVAASQAAGRGRRQSWPR